VRPLPDGLLDVYPLSTAINSSRAEGIELLTPLHGSPSPPRRSQQSGAHVCAASVSSARARGHEHSRFDDVFHHDVAPEIAAEAQRRERDEQARALREPWPLDAWPQTPTRYMLCRDDRMFPAGWARRHARERLGLEADEMEGGHYVTLSRPRELAQRLDACAASVGDSHL
jgi:Alpha/beta hydrolase family